MTVLGKLARDSLPAQPTSCCSERIASASKYVLAGRDNLSEENFRLEMIMKEWNRTGIDLEHSGGSSDDESGSIKKNVINEYYFIFSL